MRRPATHPLTLATFLLLALGAAGTAGATLHGTTSPPEGPPRVAINIQNAENHGCSDDRGGWFSFDGPDLQVRAWQGGSVVHATPHARDTSHPDWLELAEFDVPSFPVTLAIEVREAEPGQTEQAPTWMQCDVSPGPGNWLNVTLHREIDVMFNSMGDTNAAARVIGRAAATSFPHPRPADLMLGETSHECLHLHWIPSEQDPPAVAQTIRLDGTDRTLSPGATSYDWCGLRESWSYRARLVREWEGWRVAYPAEAFSTAQAPTPTPQTTPTSQTTPPSPTPTPTPSSPSSPGGSAPPPRPTVDAAAGYEEVNVTWRVETTNAVRVEVHAAPAPFSPSDWTLREERSTATGTVALAAPAGKTLHVTVIAYDGAGASSPAATAVATPLQRPAPPPPPPPRVEPRHPNLVLVHWDAPVTAGVARHEILVARAATPGDLQVAATAAATAVAAALPGLERGEDYVIALRRVNANGLASLSETAPYHHDPPNAAPSVSLRITPERPRMGDPVTLLVQVDDPDGDAVEGTVEWGDGKRDNLSTHLDHVFLSPGIHTVSARVQDALGATGEATLLVDIQRNAAPAARLRLALEPPAPTTGETVELVAEGWKDPDGDPVTFEIDWGDGAAGPGAPGASHVYASPGRYRVLMTVTDPQGFANSAAVEIVVQTPEEARAIPAPSVKPPSEGTSGLSEGPVRIPTDSLAPTPVSPTRAEPLIPPERHPLPFVAPLALLALLGALARDRRRD